MKTMTHPMSYTIAMTKITTMLPTKAWQITITMIPNYDGHYHDHYLYHHAPNGYDDDNGITNVISDDEKENSGNNDDRYDDHIPGHHCGASEDGSNDPAVSDDHSGYRSIESNGSYNHGSSR